MLQKCAKNVCKSVPKMFAKVSQKSLQKCAKKTVLQKCTKTMFCKSVPKCCQVHQNIFKISVFQNSKSKSRTRWTGLYLPASCSCFRWCQTSNDQWYHQVHFYTFPWPPNKKVNPKYLPLFPTVTSSIIKHTFISFLVKSWGSEASPLATHTFKTSYKISHPLQL